MACVSRESILAAAHAVGTELPNEIADELARDVGYRMKEIIQASTKTLIDMYACVCVCVCVLGRGERKQKSKEEKRKKKQSVYVSHIANCLSLLSATGR